MQKKIAITLGSLNGSCRELIDQAVAAEKLGYDAAWFGDTGYPDPLTVSGQVLAATKSIELGIAVVPAYSRTPAVLASSTGTLNELSQGRFILGLGSSSQTMIEKWHGMGFEKPLTRVRETVEMMRAMLAGEKSNYQGQTLKSHGFRMKAVEYPQKLYLAALRPKMLELAAEIGDGVVLNLFPQSALSKIMEHIEIGAKRGGKTLNDIEIVCRYQVAVGNDNSAELAMFRGFFGPYYATPVYNRFLAWCGYSDVADEITAGWTTKDRERTANAMSDELIQSIAIMGTKEQCHQRIKSDLSNGISTAMITTVSADPDKRQVTLEAFGKKAFKI